MKEFSQNGRLNADVILSIMCEQKPNQKEKISFQSERLKPFIPKNFTAKQAEDYVIKQVHTIYQTMMQPLMDATQPNDRFFEARKQGMWIWTICPPKKRISCLLTPVYGILVSPLWMESCTSGKTAG